uniref:HTH psq-type domain-containing protein n=1 Tax=Haemonchus contortus TaxID=6289 RepID=A0A7I4Y9Q6_HAECO
MEAGRTRPNQAGKREEADGQHKEERGIIKKRIDRKDDRSLNKMAEQLKISRNPIQMIVKNELGLRSYRILNGPALTEKAKQSRKEKCKKLLEFSEVRRLEDVLWSDEKVFTVKVAKNPQNHR